MFWDFFWSWFCFWSFVVAKDINQFGNQLERQQWYSKDYLPHDFVRNIKTWWINQLCFAHFSPRSIKGQIISECLFDVFKFSKKPTKNLTNFCPGSKKWSNYKIKAQNSVFSTSKNPYNHSITRKCLYFVDLTTF